MPAQLTYTAQREIVRAGVSVVAADISVLAADNSFNTTGVVDFSGLLAGQWVNVVGLYDPSGTNNGWHKLLSNSTAKKIITTSSLTDESAGASVAVDGFIHGAGQQYTQSINLSAVEVSRDYKKKVHTAKSGRQQTRVYRDDVYFQCTTTPASGETESSLFAYYKEAIASMSHGEKAVIDFGDGLSSIRGAVGVVLDQSSISESRVSGSKYFTMNFKLRRYEF